MDSQDTKTETGNKDGNDGEYEPAASQADMHTKLWYAQSEIAVALDMTEMLLEGVRKRKQESDASVRGGKAALSILDSITSRVGGSAGGKSSAAAAVNSDALTSSATASQQ